MIREIAGSVELRNQVDPLVFRGAVERFGKGKGEALHRAFPSINRLKEKTREGRKRAGTPPLMKGGKSLNSLDGDGDGDGKGNGVEGEKDSTNEGRADQAAMTWHDDEITGHDPNDPDDDGEGINGIGFRPTAAIAYKRMEVRRAQMEGYKSREAREARAKRSERRRTAGVQLPDGRIGAGEMGVGREERETARRVRFLEAERNSVASK